MYLRIDGEQTGPFDADEVARAWEAGRLDRRAMSWRAGEDRWLSVQKRWPRQRTPFPWRRLAGMAAAMLAVGGVFIACRSHLHGLPYRLQTGSVLFTIVAIGIAVAGTGLAVAWRGARPHGRASMWLALPSLAVVLGAIVSVALAVLANGIIELRQHADNARVTFDAADAAIRVQGFLGPRLASQVQAEWARHPQVGTLVLDSPGGLVEDALGLAAWVQARGLTTRVDGICASACAAIWAAGARHQMTATSRVGIHQLYPGTASLPSQWTGAATTRLTRQYDGFLQHAGFSRDAIARGNATAPTGMYWMNPLQVGDAGVDVAILGPHGTPVSARMARWMWLEVAATDPALGRVLTAIRERAPAVALEHADALYADWIVEHDTAAGGKELNAILTEAEQFALARVPDAAVVAWARRYFDAFGGAGRHAWQCEVSQSHSAMLHLGRTFLGEAMITDLGELLGSVDANARPRSEPLRYDHATAGVARLAMADARKYGNSPDLAKWTPTEWCTYRVGFFGFALQLPRHQAAQAVRFLEARH